MVIVGSTVGRVAVLLPRLQAFYESAGSNNLKVARLAAFFCADAYFVVARLNY